MNTNRKINRPLTRPLDAPLPRLGRALTGMTGAMLGMLISAGQATVITKADVTTTLDLGGSWVGGSAPTSGDIANWSGAYVTTGVLSTSFAVSTPVSWGGIVIGNITGTAAGTVSIGGIAAAATGSSLTLGSSGIDMSAANQNLVINSATTVLTGATQTWNVATGRNLRFGTTGTGGANANLDGNAGTVITVQGGGLVDLNQGGASGFADAAGFADFNGKWVVGPSTTLRGLRHGATAWGSNTAADTITLNGGTLATGGITGAVGNWAWNTNITVAANSTIDNQNNSGSGRWLKLSGILTGAGNLTIASTGVGTMTSDTGFIFANTNTLSGTITINPVVFVRVGGIGGTDVTTGVGSAGTLGTATVVNNGTLTLSHDNTWTFANNVSGSGILRIGLASGSTTHIVTVSGNNTHSGGTTLQTAVTLKIGSSNALGTGPFTIAGNGIFDNATGGPLSVSNALTMSGGSPTFTGTSDMAFAGAALISGATTRTITVNGSSLSLNGGLNEDVAGRNFTKNGSGTLVLGGTSGYTGVTAISAGALQFAKQVALYNNNTAKWTSPNLIVSSGATAIFNVGGSGEFSATDLDIIKGLGSGIDGFKTGATLGLDTANAVSGFSYSSNIANPNAGANVLGLSKYGNNTLALSGTNTYTGTTTIFGGTLAVSGGLAIADTSPVVLANTAGATFKLNSSETIAGLSGGGTTGGTVDINGQTLTVTPPVTHSDFGGALIGTGTVIKAGANQLRLNGTNSFSGTHQIDAGLIIFTSTGSANGSPNVVINGDANSGIVMGDVFAGGELAIGSLSGTGGKVRADWNPAVGQRTLSVNQTTDTTFAGTLEDATGGRIIGLKKNGSGILTLTSAQPYTGTTIIAGGTLALSGGGALVDGAVVSLTSSNSSFSVAAITAASETIGALTGVANSTLVLGGKELVLTGNTDAEFSGTASGSGGSLTKQGTGTFKLSGGNTYSGSTNITAGTLLLGSATALPSTATLSLSGGTLKTDGYDASTGPLSVSLALANVIDFTSNTSSLTFADSSAVTWTGLLKIFNWDGGIWDHSTGTEFLMFPNAGSLTSDQLASIQFFSNDGTTPIGTGAGFLAGTGELVPVPEPSAALAGFGLLGLVWYRERRRIQSLS